MGFFRPLRIGVKFCGGCNPHIDRSALFATLREQAEDLTFVPLSDADLAGRLFICGCPTICLPEALAEEDDTTSITVGGERVDGIPVDQHLVAATVLAKIEAWRTAADGARR